MCQYTTKTKAQCEMKYKCVQFLTFLCAGTFKKINIECCFGFFVRMQIFVELPNTGVVF